MRLLPVKVLVALTITACQPAGTYPLPQDSTTTITETVQPTVLTFPPGQTQTETPNDTPTPNGGYVIVDKGE
jgi:hypothetical protein